MGRPWLSVSALKATEAYPDCAFVDSVLLTVSLPGSSGTGNWEALPDDLAATLLGVRALGPYADKLTHRTIFDHGVQLLLDSITGAADRG